jgi:AraC-like DNA-binding protein
VADLGAGTGVISLLLAARERYAKIYAVEAQDTFAALAARKRQEEQRTAYAELPAELQRVLDLINTHFCELHSPADLLAKTFVSSATLNRWFRRYIHISPRTFLEAKKISYAKELLQRGYNVSEVSEKNGFSDCSYFIAVFRRKCGMTPLQFKRANGNE